MRERASLHGGPLEVGPRAGGGFGVHAACPTVGSDEQPIRVVLVDDQQMVRAGFRMVIDSQADLTVLGEAGDGDGAVELLRRTPADVVLMDVRMPGTDGIEATRQVTALPRPPRVVVLTTFSTSTVRRGRDRRPGPRLPAPRTPRRRRCCRPSAPCTPATGHHGQLHPPVLRHVAVLRGAAPSTASGTDAPGAGRPHAPGAGGARAHGLRRVQRRDRRALRRQRGDGEDARRPGAGEDRVARPRRPSSSPTGPACVSRPTCCAERVAHGQSLGSPLSATRAGPPRPSRPSSARRRGRPER